MSEETKKIEALEKKIEELLQIKVNLEIELETLRKELDAWKQKYETLRENVLRMGKDPEKLSKEVPKTEQKPIEKKEKRLSEKYGIDAGQAAILAIEYDVLRRGKLQPGIFVSKEEEE